MIDWWALFHNALWVTGLAIVLASASFASYQASAAGTRPRETIVGPGFQSTLLWGLGLACLGWLLGNGPWWARVTWGLLAALLASASLLWRRDGRRGAVHQKARGGGEEPAANRRARRTGWALVVAGLLVLVVWAGVGGLQVVRHARSLEAHARGLETLAQGGADALGAESLAAVGEHLAGMRYDLEAIEAGVGPLLPLGRLMAWVPTYGGDLAAADDLLEVASGVVAAGDRAFQALSPALDLDATGQAVGERFLPLLVAARPALRTARQELSAAAQARAGLETPLLSPRMGGWVERLDRLLPVLVAALDAALLAPDLLGSDAPRTYLILAQNNDELRATGGFISGVGELRVENGQIAAMAFSDSYTVDSLEVPHDLTPAAFQKTLFGELWFFRDANWDADFPTSARRALEIYARDRGVEAEGVLALDLTALQLLVDAVAPLQVEGFDGPVTGQNVVQVVRAQWASPAAGPALEEGWDPEWWQHRKDFMGEVAGAALDRLLAGEVVDAGRLVQALRRALDEKHLLVYLADPEAAGLLREQNWDGALPDPSSGSDLLLVADSNVGFNKVDANVSRGVEYRVDLGAEGGPESEVTVTYRHGVQRPTAACLQEARYSDSYAEMTERCYWDYVRVYVPPGSTLLTGPDLMLPPGSLLARSEAGETATVSPTLTENGWAVWAAFFDLETGRERTLSFIYHLPAWVLDLEPDGTVRYRLRVQKQPGTEAVPFELELVLPPGAVVVDATPAGLRTDQRLSTDLRTDREFEIVYRPVEKP